MSETLKTTSERERSKTHEGILIGAMSGGVLGLALGSALPAIAGGTAILFVCLFSALLGAVLGRVLMERILSEIMEPGISGRNHVGASAPDIDGTQTAAPGRSSRAPTRSSG